MVPQLYVTVYKEQFASPGRAKRAQLRPTSAHRRNNPQPRPDFLFPRSLQPNYRSIRTQLHPTPPVDTGRPLFPPHSNSGNMQVLSSGQDPKLATHLQLSTTFNGHSIAGLALTAIWIIAVEKQEVTGVRVEVVVLVLLLLLLLLLLLIES
ncbi:hypothetical protein INR49_012554 [Caranx melampygus]|nr:hypothetical protein INR49_012554 [Caranx melampygus]